MYTSPSGMITSPNYPSQYPSGQSCQSYIIAPPGKKIDFAFSELSLHAHAPPFPWLQQSCTRSGDDNVEVNSKQPLIVILFYIVSGCV